ncbi:MAG: preprotein translocase subunit SecE [Gammaproteobacteria bacterium]|nr:MAG: preprotein translocase subunit SecE [Gammaproteobacteria bacterium]
MVSRTELTASNPADRMKLLGAGALLLVGLVGFYWFAGESLLMRVVALLIIAGFAVYLALQTDLGRRTVEFFRDARIEVRKVVWPTRQETVQTTLTVLVIVFIVGLFLWMLDSILGWLFRIITGI